MVERLEMIEEKDGKFADVFGVALIVFEAASEAAGADEHLAGLGVVAVRLLAREGVAGDFLENAFADADGGD